MGRRSHVSMLASRRNGTVYTGSTTDLARRVYEHRTGAMPGFTRDYGVTMLVWYEEYPRLIDARVREYAIKRWRRAWKLALIEAFTPAWCDLYEELGFCAATRRVPCWVPDQVPLRCICPGKGRCPTNQDALSRAHAAQAECDPGSSI